MRAWLLIGLVRELACMVVVLVWVPPGATATLNSAGAAATLNSAGATATLDAGV